MSPVRFGATPAGVPSDRLDEFEQRHGISLPQAYRAFLVGQNGGTPETNMTFFDHDGQPVDVSVREFFGLNNPGESHDLSTSVRRLAGRFPPGFIPIAEAPCGDQFCLGVEGAQRGSVWFWEHEFEADEDEEPDFRNMTLLAANFDDFLEALEPFDVQAWLREHPGA